MNRSVISIKLNNETLLSEDAKQFIDYLSESIVQKNSKAITKRNLYLQTLNVIYKLGLLFTVVKFFPEVLAIFVR